LIAGIGRITKAPGARLEKAKLGLMKILGRDANDAKEDLDLALKKHAELEAKQKKKDKDEEPAAEGIEAT
jgi:hypothetical protein